RPPGGVRRAEVAAYLGDPRRLIHFARGAAELAVRIDGEIPGVVEGPLLEIWHHVGEEVRPATGRGDEREGCPVRWKGPLGRLECVGGRAEWLEVVAALGPPRRLAGGLDGGQ